MIDLEVAIQAANPIHEEDLDSAAGIPSFDEVWLAAQEPIARSHHDLVRRSATSRIRFGWRVTVLSGAALTAGAVGLVLSIGTSGSGPTSAFAAWTAAPTRPVSGEIASAAARCGQTVVPTLADTRGPYELLLYREGDRIVECRHWVGSNGGGFGEIAAAEPAPSSADSITLWFCNSGGHTSSEQQAVFRQSYGYAGSGVTGVTLDLRDGTTVTATTENGLWAAWWPGSSGLAAVEVTTAAGTQSLKVTDPSCA